MNIVRFLEIHGNTATLENGYELSSEHESDCCETHDLSFTDAEGLIGFPIDLDSEWFKRIDGYGLELVPADARHPCRVPGYGSNNGYYGTNIDLVLRLHGRILQTFDVSECQKIEG